MDLCLILRLAVGVGLGMGVGVGSGLGLESGLKLGHEELSLEDRIKRAEPSAGASRAGRVKVVKRRGTIQKDRAQKSRWRRSN